MLLTVLLGVLATLIVFPDIPMARSLHRLLVDPVARRLNRVRPGHILFAAAMAGIGAVLILAFEGEGLKVFGMLAPDAVGWFAMFDVTLFVDVFAMAVAVAVTTRLKVVRDQIVARVRTALTPVRSALSGRRQRARRDGTKTSGPKRPEDPDPWGEGYAFG